ncbi:serine/threonine protein kinase [Streptomyces sp. Ag109_O5-1]|uniref:serine/threonine-protein kinase n=1 Tax=Streptomyces sp. Ag109_O5-1 TaxID=1938851 RepID=UPI000F4E65DB|nr:serine/threonine-protein kinase [Streptomyces sp. Ag109_O5-1]RPE42429.1 serine/threonine protein kinase [Streptomyces sp. Ag109_O5-1]
MGEVFAGRYELADPIGHGGVGAVWRAWDHRRKRYVAAKVLQQSDAHALLRFVREQALRIDHPHVLAPASWAADDDKVLFTMDLVAGGSLVHLVGDYGPLPPAFVCTLLDQLLSGLAAVHAEGVVHRDIKPANILLEASGTARPRLRLSDFGIAMRFGEARLTETNLVVGTPGYIAPEQLLGAEPDFAADLYAVGLVALYLLEGAKPDAKALVQYFAEHGTPGAPKGVPEPLWQVVATLVQPDPQSRFRTATGARKALAQARELLPEPDIDDETIEIFDQLGPLPPGFEPEGPVRVASGVDTARVTPGDSGTTATAGTGTPTAAAARQAGVQAAGAADARAGVQGAGGQAVAPGTAAGAAGGPGMPGGPAAAAATGSGPAVAAGPEAGSGMAAGAGSGTATGAGRASASSPVRPGHADAPPSTGTDRAGSSSAPVSMSDTGSFRLPPPQTPTPGTPYAEHPGPTPPYPPYTQQQPQPLPQPQQATPTPTPTPQPQTPWPPAQPLPPVQEVRPDADTTTTATYTARDPRTPQAAQSQLSAVRTHGRRRRRARRAGPPAKAAVPILLLALACYAVGFWALTRI